uniref:C2H2-type domain-containing protein n=1 Tax=Romanomermis culicivorax TaxID=13658 RepID=A0A915IAS5_ROMCU
PQLSDKTVKNPNVYEYLVSSGNCLLIEADNDKFWENAGTCSIEKKFFCTICSTQFTHSSGLRRHHLKQHPAPICTCQYCSTHGKDNGNQSAQEVNNEEPDEDTESDQQIDLETQSMCCCKDVCTNVINILIEGGQVASYDGNNTLTDLKDIGGCKASAGQCISIEGTILWEEWNVTNGIVRGVNETDHPYKITFLDSCLMGPALASYQDLSSSTPQPTRYKEFTAFLQKDFLVGTQNCWIQSKNAESSCQSWPEQCTPSSLALVNEICHLQQEMAWLTAHIA